MSEGDLPRGQCSPRRDRPRSASRARRDTRRSDVLGLRRLDDDASGRLHRRQLRGRTVGRLASVRRVIVVDDLRPVPDDHQRTRRAGHVRRRIGRQLRLLRRRTCTRLICLLSLSLSADPCQRRYWDFFIM